MLNEKIIDWAKASSRTRNHLNLKLEYCQKMEPKHLDEDGMFQILAYPGLNSDQAFKQLVNEYGKTWCENLNAIVCEYNGGTVIDIRGVY